MGDLCDNIGLVLACLSSGGTNIVSPSEYMTQPSGIPTLSPVLFMRVDNPYIPPFNLLVKYIHTYTLSTVFSDLSSMYWPTIHGLSTHVHRYNVSCQSHVHRYNVSCQCVYWPTISMDYPQMSTNTILFQCVYILANYPCTIHGCPQISCITSSVRVYTDQLSMHNPRMSTNIMYYFFSACIY